MEVLRKSDRSVCTLRSSQPTYNTQRRGVVRGLLPVDLHYDFLRSFISTNLSPQTRSVRRVTTLDFTLLCHVYLLVVLM